MIVLAVTKQREVGVDVESRTHDTSCVDIAERFFSPREVEDFRSLSGDEQRGRFYDLWTLKKAYIKARGMGLALPLDGFSFQFPVAHAIEIAFSQKITDDAPNWRFWLLKPSPDYPVAVAVKGKSPEEQFHICSRDFVPPAGYAVVEWPCVRSSANLGQRAPNGCR
jgi:4'-phosphopantetheinyl transferase